MGELLRKILDSAVKFGYLRTLNKELPLNKTDFSFGPLATLLANNIYNEWFQSFVINSELNMFWYNSDPSHSWQEDCQSSYHYAVQLSNDQLPFGLVSLLTNFEPVKCTSKSNNLLSVPSLTVTKAYRSLIFIGQKESQQFFYRLQRQRRMWWRKYSTDPERFSIIDEKCSEDNREQIQISAKFPWSTNILEIIEHHGSQPLSPYGTLFEAKVGRKKQVPHVVECIYLETPAVMTYLCDAFQQLQNRPLLRLDYSLAPYKTAFAIDSTDDKADELYQLARFLCLKLRKAGVHTLFSPIATSKSKKSHGAQFTSYDLMGIPFTIVIPAEALKNGIVGLRSRDTTLQEEVHVSNLTEYMQKILGI